MVSRELSTGRFRQLKFESGFMTPLGIMRQAPIRSIA